jgi:hypothetical protein
MTESNPLEPHRADRDLKVANAIRELLEREFPATDTPPRQRRTGRNVQLNIKATAEVVERFVALSDRRRWALGETLEYALAALEKALAKWINARHARFPAALGRWGNERRDANGQALTYVYFEGEIDRRFATR